MHFRSKTASSPCAPNAPTKLGQTISGRRVRHATCTLDAFGENRRPRKGVANICNQIHHNCACPARRSQTVRPPPLHTQHRPTQPRTPEESIQDTRARTAVSVVTMRRQSTSFLSSMTLVCVCVSCVFDCGSIAQNITRAFRTMCVCVCASVIGHRASATFAHNIVQVVVRLRALWRDPRVGC